ncbi:MULTISPECIES: single-stranded DNA-binding protein [Bacilli]|jgi:single-strand DNA-binding protein|uniref:single-stranded DNA-binding protein n=1 Tax=Bacilli TaxID=91061 RepID=UPI000DC712B3|nr:MULTISPECIES: single-stranded DNA-binding protein [Bacilli]DAI76935.1 MAG TPA: Single strand binding protein [Caudoviricetes sp.]ARJ08746.1 single-stranded DNA-binding protein [Staphylococcus lugdunensis]MCI2764767.1 single-stranded DNA-binding protein [Staphylococcus lugdunensis]MCI2801155.1 single-stranded DNA-binding protein [Staphylococcus lugdunensis]MDK7194614.1 single-stranded DNA-binding protein [Lactobacillus gasseri]
MNTVNLLGNLVADPELRGQNSNVANFRIAVQRPFKNKQTNEYETDFITCVAFGKTAEIITNNFKKGNKIGVTGSIQTGSYEKDGQRVYTTDVAVNQVTFVERKNNNAQSNNQQQNGQAQSDNNPFSNGMQNANGPIDISDEDLPF